MAQQQKILPKPVDWDELYPGRFLKAVDFKGGKVTLRISEVKIEELVGDKGPQIKGVISFEKMEKQWALNKTNGICLKEMFGKKVQEWVGKRVTLFPSQWDGEDCIRVWGSPEIDADRNVTIALPRKRPFQMTMHRTAVTQPRAVNGNGSAAAPTGVAPDQAKAIADLRATVSLDAYTVARKSVWALYAGAGAEVPIDVEAAANDHREALEQQEGSTDGL